MAKRKKRAILKDKAHKLWSLLIRRKYPRCVMCGTEENLQAHHCIEPAGRSDGVKYLLSNGITLCYHCHIHKEHGSASKTWRDTLSSIIDSVISKDDQQNIHEIGHKNNKLETCDIEEIIVAFQKALDG